MANVEESAGEGKFFDVALTAVIAALSFVVGLFWRDAIVETINIFVPEGEGLLYRYLAAILVTVIVVVVIYLLSRFLKREEK